MQAMQYEITLPRDYDMGIIRERVATRGSRTDRFPGLATKAYLIREQGRDGSSVNQYAPFYLWADPAGMNEFLFGPGFDGIRTDFGRPVVHTWNGIALYTGPRAAAAPIAATRELRAVDQGVSLPVLVESLVEEARAAAQEPGIVCTATAIDPFTWRLVRFTLWADGAPEHVAGERYQVLHTSRPFRDDLSSGRQW